MSIKLTDFGGMKLKILLETAVTYFIIHFIFTVCAILIQNVYEKRLKHALGRNV